MLLLKSLSTAFIKLSLFFTSVGWILFYINDGRQESIIEETYLAQFRDLNFSYQQEKKNVDCRNKTILIAISSTTNNLNLRMGIRNEWARNFNSTVIYRFFVGLSLNESIKQACLEESKKYNDVVLSNILDSSVTDLYKTYSIFNWQQEFCPSVKYILRSQDTTLINIQRLLYWIDKKLDKEYNSTDGKVIFCRTAEHFLTNVKYKLKWKNKREFDYCQQNTYLITSKAANLMLSQAKNETIITSSKDLTFTGLLAETIGAKRIHSPTHFTLAKTNCGCDKSNVPYAITTEWQWREDNATLITEYSLAAQEFSNMTCPKNRLLTTKEYFAACVAHTI